MLQLADTTQFSSSYCINKRCLAWRSSGSLGQRPTQSPCTSHKLIKCSMGFVMSWS